MVQAVEADPWSTRLIRWNPAGTPLIVPALPRRNTAQQIQTSPAAMVVGGRNGTVVEDAFASWNSVAPLSGKETAIREPPSYPARHSAGRTATPPIPPRS